MIVDCIEFSPAFRAVDVAADLSFLAMELEALGRADGARPRRDYAEAAGDPLVPALIPFHACHRAIVRGKVEGLAADDEALDADERRQAGDRLAGALRAGEPLRLAERRSVVIACAGLSGTGKSTVAGCCTRRRSSRLRARTSSGRRRVRGGMGRMRATPSTSGSGTRSNERSARARA